MSKQFYVYIMTNNSNKVLYTGVTSDLVKRIYQHKNHQIKNSFTDKYNLNKLVYFETADSSVESIKREKQIKAGSRKKKNSLIEKLNSNWYGLWEIIKS